VCVEESLTLVEVMGSAFQVGRAQPGLESDAFDAEPRGEPVEELTARDDLMQDK